MGKNNKKEVIVTEEVVVEEVVVEETPIEETISEEVIEVKETPVKETKTTGKNIKIKLNCNVYHNNELLKQGTTMTITSDELTCFDKSFYTTV